MKRSKKSAQPTNQLADEPAFERHQVLLRIETFHRQYEEEGVQYGSWSESLDMGVVSAHKIDSAEQAKTLGRHGDIITLNQPIEEGQSIFVLVMRYTTGDSFGSSSGNLEIIWADPRKEVVEAMEEHIEKHPEASSWLLPFEDGVIQLNNPSSGYFERMESVSMEELVIQEWREIPHYLVKRRR